MIEVESKLPKKYKYVLETEIGNLTLNTSPIEWNDMKLQFSRSDEFHGVFTEFIIDKLTFIEEGKVLLEDLFTEKGLMSEANLRVYYLDYTTYAYVELPTSYKLDFNTRYLIKNSKSTNAVQINALPIGIVTKLKQRKGTNVDLTRTRSIGEFDIIDYAALKKNIVIPEIYGYFYANFLSDTSNTFLIEGTDFVGEEAWFLVQETQIFSDFIESKTVNFVKKTVKPDRTEGILFNSDEDRTVIVTGTITANVKQKNGVATIYLSKVNSSNVFTDIDLGLDYSTLGIQTITIDETLVLSATDSIVLYGHGLVGLKNSYELEITYTDLKFTEVFVQTEQVTVQGFPVYEALERNCQLMLDKQFPFYSEYFGRTDTVKNLAGEYYASENQGRFGHILNGLSIRGLILSDENNAVTSKFTKLYKALDAMYCLGLTVEEVDGDYRVRIEERNHFYENAYGMNLTGRVTNFEIEEEVISGKAFAKIVSGFKKYEYEAGNGRGEYNTTNERTSIIPNDAEFNNVSEVRGDTRGITLALEKPMSEFGTEDVKGDNDLFWIKTQRESGYWKAETDENIQIVDETSLYQDGSLNLPNTPTRNLLNHKEWIVVGLDKNKGSYLSFQTADTLQTLKTTDGVTEITENQDLLVDDLGDPRIEPILLKADIPFTEADYVELKSKLKKYHALSDTKKGWIHKLVWSITKKTASVELIKRYE